MDRSDYVRLLSEASINDEMKFKQYSWRDQVQGRKRHKIISPY